MSKTTTITATTTNGTKIVFFGYLWGKIFKNCSHISNQHPQICPIANFAKKQKCLNLGQKRPYLGLSGLEFKKTIAILEISTLKFVQLQNFAKITKISKFGTKNALFGYFWARILTNYCHN